LDGHLTNRLFLALKTGEENCFWGTTLLKEAEREGQKPIAIKKKEKRSWWWAKKKSMRRPRGANLEKIGGGSRKISRSRAKPRSDAKKRSKTQRK